MMGKSRHRWMEQRTSINKNLEKLKYFKNCETATFAKEFLNKTRRKEFVLKIFINTYRFCDNIKRLSVISKNTSVYKPDELSLSINNRV